MNAKLVLVPIVALVLTACGGAATTNPAEAKAEAQAVAARTWDSQSAGSHAASCVMYRTDKASFQKLLEHNTTYKDKTPEERQMFVDAVFALLDKEC
jgi:outer membrane biogenesis lipoprotein LolB